jgi:hypothetical protein
MLPAPTGPKNHAARRRALRKVAAANLGVLLSVLGALLFLDIGPHSVGMVISILLFWFSLLVFLVLGAGYVFELVAGRRRSEK